MKNHLFKLEVSIRYNRKDYSHGRDRSMCVSGVAGMSDRDIMLS